nr:rhomboid family intramembrane serine protease [uncultured Flavobacterium sp.]
MMNITPVVKQLLIINIIFFIGAQLVPVTNDFFSLYSFQSSNFEYWQIITHMFMHGGIMHIAFNMFALYSFGSALEHYWGGKRFVFFYISCGLGAALLQMGINYLELQHILQEVSSLKLSADTLHQILNATISDNTVYRPDLFELEIKPIFENAGKLNLLNQETFNSLFNAAQSVQVPMVGASGAIYGLLIAFAFMFPNAELAMMFIPIPIKAKYFVPGLLLIDLYLGVSGGSIFGGSSGIAHFAHIGGAIVGFVMMWYWRNNKFKHNRWN